MKNHLLRSEIEYILGIGKDTLNHAISAFQHVRKSSNREKNFNFKRNDLDFYH